MIWAEIFRSKLIVHHLRSLGHNIEENVFVSWGAHICVEKDGSLFIGKNTRLDRDSELFVHSKAQMHIGQNVYIGKRNIISAMKSVRIGDQTITAHQVTVIDSNHKFQNSNTPIAQQGSTASAISIGKNSWIAANATILEGVQLGDNIVVAAQSLVNKDFDKNTLIAGIPAQPMKSI